MAMVWSWQDHLDGMARVFLSHSSLDSGAAKTMREWLIEQGFDAPFLDFDKDTGIALGDNWEQRLYRELERSQAILLLLTANWQASKWCFAEFTQARALGKPVLPVVAGPLNADVGAVAGDVQAISLLDNHQEGMERLRAKLSELALSIQGGIPWDAQRAPYPGLASHEQEDAAVYFGREPEIRQVVERLTARRSLGGSALVVVLGASGAGKSSLLRAGVLPRLQRSGRQWIVPPPFRPQRRPLDSLALSLVEVLGSTIHWEELSNQMRQSLSMGTQHVFLDKLANELRAAASSNQGSILLSIDQCEELFLQSDPEERHQFLHLLNAAIGRDLPYIGLMTLRSDALGLLQAEERLTLSLDQLSLSPLPLERLEEVISGPAELAGIHLESALLRNMLRDASTGDALPLLAFTLRELYDRSFPDHQLTVSAYESLGDSQLGLTPLENAVRSAADRALAMQAPDPSQLESLRRAFIPKMVCVNSSGDYARRAAGWDELPKEAQPLLEALVAARVLTLRQEQGVRRVEVSHESLLRKWPLLRGWLDEARQFLLDLANLNSAQKEWNDAAVEDKSRLLLSGLKLNRARILLQEKPAEFSPDLRSYVEQSIAREDQEQLRLKVQRQRIFAGLASLTTIATVAAGVAVWQLHQARLAQIQSFSSTAFGLYEKEPLNAAINALAAMEGMDVNLPIMKFREHRLLGALGMALSKNAAISRRSLPIPEPAAFLRLEDSSILLADREGKFIRLGSGQSKGMTLSATHPGVRVLASNDSGGWLSVSRDGSLRRWLGIHPLGPAVGGGQRGVVSLAALPAGMAVTGALDGSLRWWRDGQPVGLVRNSKLGPIWAIQPLKDGSILVGTDSGHVQRWLPAGAAGPAMLSGQGSVRSLAVLADGTWVSGGEDGTVRLWRKGRPLAAIGPRAFGSVNTLTSWGRRNLAWSIDSGGLVLWRDDNPPGFFEIRGQSPVRALQLGDGNSILSLGDDGQLSSWRWPKPPPWLQQTGQKSIRALLAQQSGTLVTGGWDGTLRQFQGLNPLQGTIQTGQGPIRILQQLEDGSLLVGGLDATLQIWHQGIRKGKSIPTAQVGVRSALVLRNGDWISGGYDGRVRRWRQLKEMRPALVHGDLPVTSLAELPNGEILSGDAHGIVRRLRWPNWQGRPIQTGQRLILSIQPLADNEWLTAGRNGTLKRWKDGQVTGTTLNVEREDVSWRLVQLPSGGGLVVSNGSNDYLRKLVSPRLAVRIACDQLGGLPELRSPQAPAERAASRLCKKMARTDSDDLQDEL